MTHDNGASDKCPGCDLENTKIVDGVCQWCGYTHDNAKPVRWRLDRHFLTYYGKRRCWSIGFPSIDRIEDTGTVHWFTFYWWKAPWANAR